MKYNDINDLEDLIGRMAKDKYNDQVKIINVYQTPGYFPSATILKANGEVKTIPLSNLRIIED
jgi:hypothetical protein